MTKDKRDILVRLRQRPIVAGKGMFEACELLDDAAAEIERLRDQVTSLLMDRDMLQGALIVGAGKTPQ